MKALRHVLIAVSVGIALSTQLAYAEDSGRTFALDIKSQPLTDALNAFGQQSGLQIVFYSRYGEGLTSPGLQGNYSPQVALEMLLANTELRYEFINTRTVAIRPKHDGTGPEASVESPASEQLLRLAQQEPPAIHEQRTALQLAQSEENENQELERGKKRKTNDRSAGAIPEILVKDSRILNMDIPRSRDDAQPYVILDRETIEKSSATNLEDLLRKRLTMNTQTFTFNQVPDTGNGNRSRVNLRGLGEDETLILINGRRTGNTVSYGTPGQPNLNGIPLAAVERIEILPTTASGIYGGSATGGVVNVILRKDYSGAETTVKYGNTTDSKSSRYEADLSLGLNLEAGKTTVLLAASYVGDQGLRVGDRTFLKRGRDWIMSRNPNYFLNAIDPPLGATPNIRSADGSDLVLENGTSLGSPITYVPVGYGGVATDGGEILRENAGQYNLDVADTQQSGGGGQYKLLTEETSKSLMVTVRRNLTSSVAAFIDFTAATESIRFPADTFGAPTYTISASAPNNPFLQDISVKAPIAGGVEALVKNKSLGLVGGLIIALPHDWGAQIDYSRSRYRLTPQGDPVFSFFGAEISSIMNGSIDILRGVSDYSSSLLPYVQRQDPTSQSSTTTGSVLRFAGPALSLPGGELTLASSVEHRKDFIDSATISTIFGTTFIHPSRWQSVDSAYLEMRVPLISPKNSIAAVQELELQLAGRWDDYTVNGVTNGVTLGEPITRDESSQSSVNPTLGLRYQPTSDVTLRTSYSTGFLPPTVNQIIRSSQTVNGSNSGIRDPRRGNELVGVITQLVGGNPDLLPEDSSSWSAGIILTPRKITGLRLSVDWSTIDKTNNISFIPTLNTGALQAAILQENILPGRVVRSAPSNDPNDPFPDVGKVSLVNTSLINLSKAKLEAYDVQLDYELPTAARGSFDIFAMATWQPHFKTVLGPGQPTEENAGFRLTGAVPIKFQGNAQLTWKYAGWTLNWSGRYIDSYQLAPAEPAFATTLINQGNGGRIPSQFYHDIFGSYHFSSIPSSRFLTDTEIQLGITNVFNTTPPVDVFDETRFYSLLGDPHLRAYYLALKKAFGG